MKETAIAVTNLAFNYGRQNVLDGLSLEVPTGISFGLLGPNGAGKTTLIRLLVGLLRAKSGTILTLGQKPSPSCPPSTMSSPSSRTWNSSPASTA
jgi:ABC-2 type transport system ATP-binding protein